MSVCNKEIPPSRPTPRSCAVCGLGPCPRSQQFHSPLPVEGYRPQGDDTVGMVNANKRTEEVLLRQLDAMRGSTDYDQRWLAVARTHLEEGFMAFNRAIFRPARVKLPADD